MRPVQPDAFALQPSRMGQPNEPQKLSDKAARDFEAMLLRQMLSRLENTTHAGERGPLSAGSSLHASMMINVLADALAAAGGLGLAQVLRADMHKTPEAPATQTQPDRPAGEAQQNSQVHAQTTVQRNGSHA